MTLETNMYLRQKSRKSKSMAQTFIAYFIILISRQFEHSRKYEKDSNYEKIEKQLVSSLKLIEQYCFSSSEFHELLEQKTGEDKAEVELNHCSEKVQIILFKAVESLEFLIKTQPFKSIQFKNSSSNYLKRIRFNLLGDYVKVIVVNPLLPPPWRPKTLPTLKNKTEKNHKKAGTL